MSEPAELTKAFAALGEFFVGDASMTGTLTRDAELTTRAVPGAVHVGITMVIDGKVGTYVFTDPDVARIDRAQYETGEGPCIEAFRTGTTVAIPSTRNDRRFPAFARLAASHGVRSTLSLPLATNHGTVGALNLYGGTEDAFAEESLDVASQFANQAAFVLANSQAYWDARHLSENLRAAMESRATIEQAKGLLIAATGCSPDDAFRQLVVQSQYENVKLRDLAARLVANAQGRQHAQGP